MTHCLTRAAALRATLRRPRSSPYQLSSFTTTTTTPSQVVFDTAFKARQRDNLAARQSLLLKIPDLEEAERFNYLRDEIADRLVDRLDDLDHARRFSKAADIGCWSGHVVRAVERRPHLLSQNTLQDFALYDQSRNMLELTKQKQTTENGEQGDKDISQRRIFISASVNSKIHLDHATPHRHPPSHSRHGPHYSFERDKALIRVGRSKHTHTTTTTTGSLFPPIHGSLLHQSGHRTLHTGID